MCYSKNVEDHLTHLEAIFDRLREGGLKIKLKKSNFFQEEVEYLGHILSAGGISTSPRIITAIKNFPVPKSKKDVQSFVGLANYYRRFIPDFAHIVRPLYDLIPKNQKFKWDDVHNNVFENIKEKLTTAPILAFPDFEKHFYVTTDASKIAIAAVLSQKDANGRDQPIAYASRSLKGSEERYSNTDRELLATMYGITQFRPYIWGRKFTLITDHQPLKLLKESKRHTQRGNKWYLELQDYQFNVEHRAGKKIPHVDALSRYPCDANEITDNESENELDIEFDETDPADDLYADDELDISYLGIQDSDISDKNSNNYGHVNNPRVMIITPELEEVEEFDEPPIHNDVTSDAESAEEEVEITADTVTEWEPDFPIEKWSAAQRRCPELRSHYYTAANKPQQDLYVLDHDEVLYQKVDGKYLVYVPVEYRRQVIKRYHDIPISGHYGVEKTYQLMKKRMTFPRMKTEIFKHVSACDVCQKYKHRRGQATLKLTRIPPFPFHTISIDVVGPLPRAVSGFKYVLVIQDVLTRWIEFIPMTKTDGPVTIKHVIRYMLRYGVPDRILTDCGSNFMGKLFEEMCRVFSTRHINTTPYRPQANGENERSHAALHRLFGILQRELKSVGHWPDYCPLITYIHNTVYHVTIKRSPYEALFGHPPPIKPFGLPEMEYDVTDDVHTFLDLRQESLRILTDTIRDTILNVRHTSLEYANKNRKNPEYLVGDEVLVRNDQAKLLVDRKWGPLFSEPHKITRLISDVAIETIDSDGKKHTLHVDRVKKYKRQTFEESEKMPTLPAEPIPDTRVTATHNTCCSGALPLIIQPATVIPAPTITADDSSSAPLSAAVGSTGAAPNLFQSVAKAVRNRLGGPRQHSNGTLYDRRQTRSMTKKK
jgi:hypothetical protein